MFSYHENQIPKYYILKYLLNASKNNNPDALEKLISRFSNTHIINTGDSYSVTNLHWSTLLGYAKNVEILLRHGANANVVDSDGWTPLHHAADFGYFDIARLLIDYRANPNSISNEGWSPLGLAMHEGYSSVVSLLQSIGAKTCMPKDIVDKSFEQKRVPSSRPIAKPM